MRRGGEEETGLGAGLGKSSRGKPAKKNAVSAKKRKYTLNLMFSFQ